MIRQSHCPWYRLLFFLLLVLPATAFALPTLSISSPGSDGVFLLRGDQMDGVAGLDLSIGYDSATLSNPRVTMGNMVQGMMSAANPGNPIRLAIVGTRGLAGSGIIASVAFDRTGNSLGVITLVAGTLIDAGGKKVAMAQPVIVNPSAVVGAADGGTGAAQPGEEARSGTPSGGTALPIAVPRPLPVGGTVTMPGQETATGQADVPAKETPARIDAPLSQEGAPAVKKRLRTKNAQLEGEEAPLDRGETPPPPEQETPAAEASAPRPQVTQPVAVTSVLDRFKAFQGERTPANLIALFRQDAPVPFRQLPPVALADGKATVTLVIGTVTGEATPSFTFSGCTYVAHRRTEAGWEIQARPKRDVVKADITMLYGGLRQQMPLAVAPRASLVSGMTRPVKEADFERFLKDRGTPSRPRFDLNKDGRRDYVDDYIYAVNYLVRTGLQVP
ncbi:cohesin domain-containing protein [Geomonas nitrogeniifigens]|uniref:Cohesin domain-containing protein n=1 Tax=Geomonas diazotrophica TaxID=2843197 RepID=A0ABX8JHY8_9BACT|nr:cohesin domain-containing protein [Geomonas nitrogeniifigens]QWV96264.1 cohesin domain-containing protein [Geomonas nitrogeniifigens]